MQKLFVFFTLFIILSSCVNAIGISPPLYRLDFEEETNHTFKFKIQNKEGTARNVRMYAEGPLAQYVTFSVDEFDFAGAGDYVVEAYLALPAYEDITTFGRQRININAEEFSTAGGTFNAVTAVEGALFVQIPQPGFLAEITDLQVENTVEGYDTRLMTTVINRGTEPIADATLQITITSTDAKTVETVSFDDIDLAPAKSLTKTADIDASSFISGKYTATASLQYHVNNRPAQRSAVFFVGSTDISLVSYTPELVKGEINRINLTMQSLWGSPLKNVRGVLVIDNTQQNLQVLDFQPFEEKTIQAFIELPAELNGTTKDALLSLSIPVEGQDDVVEDFDLTFSLMDPPKASNTTTTVIISIVVVVAILLLALIALKVRKVPSKKMKK